MAGGLSRRRVGLECQKEDRRLAGPGSPGTGGFARPTTLIEIVGGNDTSRTGAGHLVGLLWEAGTSATAAPQAVALWEGCRLGGWHFGHDRRGPLAGHNPHPASR